MRKLSRFLGALLVPLLPGLALAQQPRTTTPTPPAMSSPAKIVDIPAAVRVAQHTDIEAKGFLGVIGQKITPRATLRHRATGAPIGRKILSFTIAGQPAGSAVTGVSGEAEIPYHVPNKPPGNWPVEIRFAGDDDWLPSSESVTLGVFQASTKLKLKLQLESSNWNEGETLQLTVTLHRTSDGGVVDGREVTMTVDGKVIEKSATSTGGGFGFDYKLPPGAAPKVRIQGQFEGDVLYAASAATLDVPVKPPAPPVKKGKLHASDARGKRGETITLSVLLVPANPMITVNGGAGGLGARFHAVYGGPQQSGNHPEENQQLCTATTGPDGRGSCTFKLGAMLPRPHYALLCFANFNEGWSVEPSYGKSLDIEPAPVRFVVTGPSSARIGDTIHVKARLTTTLDNKPLPDASVSMGGATATTNAAGEATLTFAVSSQVGVGAQKFKATYPGKPDVYEKGEATLTIQVSPKVN